MPRVWDRFLTEQDTAHLRAVGERQPFGFGARPAVLSVDNYRWALGDEAQPLLESVKTWPASTGLTGWTAVTHIESLFWAARNAGVPLIHITGLNDTESGVENWGRRSPREAQEDAAALERRARRFDFIPQARPAPGEAVLRKTAPSAFFGTPLMAHLNALAIDTLIVCGETTSGCIRATVVDGRSFRFKVVVVEECVYDRHEAAHAINLFDMHQKYADVLALDTVTAWIDAYGRRGNAAVDRPAQPLRSISAGHSVAGGATGSSSPG